MDSLLDAVIADAPTDDAGPPVRAAWWNTALAIVERACGEAAAHRLERVDPGGVTTVTLVDLLRGVQDQRLSA